MRKIAIILLATSLFACSKHAKQLTGKYPNIPFNTHSERSFDEVWTKVIDYFAHQGLPIQNIDKASGIIVGMNTDLLNYWSYEKKGVPEKSDAWVVLPDIGGISPVQITGIINIRVKPEGSGSNVNVNLTNLVALSDKPQSPKWRTFPAKSTGVFEKLIADIVK